MKRILVVEDKVEECENARRVLESTGYRDFKISRDVPKSLDEMKDFDCVLTDLFFVTEGLPGNLQTGEYVLRFLPLYDAYRERRFAKIKENGPVLRAVKVCAEVFGVSPAEYVNDFISKMNTPPSVLKAAKDAVAGIADSEEYEKYLLIEERIRTGSELPLGIVVSEKALELGKPCVVVTSTYHHSHSFEAVRDLVRVPYIDSLVDGKKNWKGGLEILEMRLK